MAMYLSSQQLLSLSWQEKEDSQRKGFGAQQAKPKPRKKAPEQKPFQVQNSLNEPQSPADEWEANIVKTLAFLFILFFCEGIFLAIAVSSWTQDCLSRLTSDIVFVAMEQSVVACGL